MFLPAHAVQALADFLEEYLDPKIVDEEGFDPNDFILVKGFILPHLVECRETGVDTEDLEPKGWMITAGFLPVVLASDLSKESYGALARAMQIYFLEQAIQYIGYIQDANYEENLDRINQNIGFAMLKSGTGINGSDETCP